MKFSEMKDHYRNSCVSYIEQRWEQLNGLEKEWGERSLKYLMLTNSGGAIAVLSFIGASKASGLSVKVSLILFVIGVILVGISTAKQFFYMSGLLKGWKKDVQRFYNDEVDWNDLLNQDEERVKVKWVVYAIPFASFACFIIGSIAGGLGLLCASG